MYPCKSLEGLFLHSVGCIAHDKHEQIDELMEELLEKDVNLRLFLSSSSSSSKSSGLEKNKKKLFLTVGNTAPKPQKSYHSGPSAESWLISESSFLFIILTLSINAEVLSLKSCHKRSTSSTGHTMF